MEPALNIAVFFAYVFTILLSLVAISRQKAKIAYHPQQVHADRHIGAHEGELMLHRSVVNVLVGSFVVRLYLMSFDPALWFAIALTVLAVLPTVIVLFPVWRMAWEDMTARDVPGYGKVVAAVMLLCALGLWADQVWRVVMLFG